MAVLASGVSRKLPLLVLWVFLEGRSDLQDANLLCVTCCTTLILRDVWGSQERFDVQLVRGPACCVFAVPQTCGLERGKQELRLDPD